MMPGTSASGTKKMFERLRGEFFNSCPLPEPDYITFSAGIVEYVGGDTELSLLKKTDDALYKAKENGRDRCEVLI